MFPFNQPAPTAFYLVLYLATLVLHVVPMNYVLAGSTYLAISAACRAFAGKSIADGEIDRVLKEWMPFALSVAITMGVAPLLFLQVLYKESFYTANLLLFHRWMAILPVLIAAFYLLYVQKSKAMMEGHPWRRLAVAVGVLACFGFVAWSWTENHLLSTRGLEAWTEQYATGGLFYGDPELPPRLALWFVGAFPTLAMIAAWQLREKSGQVAKPLGAMALSTLAAAAVTALVYGFTLPGETRSYVLTQAGLYLGLAALGAATEVWAWVAVWRAGRLATTNLAIATAGALAATGGMTVVREARRLASVDIAGYYEAHAQASRVGGVVVFLLFFVVNALLIAGVVALIRREHRQAADSDPQEV